MPRFLRYSASAIIDPDVPSTARAYSALLGGKDVYESDRKIVAALEHACGRVEAALRVRTAHGID